MRWEPEQKERAKKEGHVLFNWEVDYRNVPEEQRQHRGQFRQWGTMPMERAMRIRAILNEEES